MVTHAGDHSHERGNMTMTEEATVTEIHPDICPGGVSEPSTATMASRPITAAVALST